MDPERDDVNRTEPSGPSPDGRLERAGGDGVLGALPRTRPQRVSPRRAVAQAKRGNARQATEPIEPKTEPSATKPARPKTEPSATKPSRPKTARSKGRDAKEETSRKVLSGRGTTSRKAVAGRGTASRKTAPRPPARPPAPKQGYEPEEELELGRSVRPPGAAELIESVADIFLELASASLRSGGRALREALSPLRRS